MTLESFRASPLASEANARTQRSRRRGKYRTACLALVLVSCGQTKGPPSEVVVANAIGAAVSFDQSLIAYYTRPSRLSGGPFTGSLEVMPLPSGSATSLAEGVFGASFGASVDTLYFAQRPTLDPTTQEYTGTLSIWRSGLHAPVALSSGFVPRSVTTADHSATLFLDTPEPDQDAAGQVKLLRTSECAGTSCPVQTLGDAVMVTAMRMSLDGRYAAYDTKAGASADADRAVFLVSVTGGATTQVATPTIPAQLPFAQELSSLSPDGSLLATLTTISGQPLQLQVLSTATGTPVPWSTPPAGTMGENLQFADAATLFVGAQDARGNTAVYRTTATATSLIVSATQFFLSYVPAGAERYLFFSTTAATALASKAPYDLQMLDLSAPNAVPVLLAHATRGTPSISNDLSTAWFLDPYNTTTGLGAVVAASLPEGRLSTVASAASFSGGANFCAGTNQLFYFGTPTGPSRAVANASDEPLYDFSQGTSRQVDPDGLRWISASNPPTVYVTADNPLRIYREPLP